MDNSNPTATSSGRQGRINERVAILERYYDLLSESSASFELSSANSGFEPSMELPLLDDSMRQFLSAATAHF
jgi:hypothetical protein